MPDAQMIGPYRLERVLGTGSFATVWLAYDDVLDRQVAVKILADNWSRDNDVRRRFLAEARLLLTVESPRIVRGFHIGESPAGQPYLVMAYADRGTLGDRIDQRRREGRTFDARETVGIATEVLYALADVHASGHLHRDVKPSNVLIRSSSTQRNIDGLAGDETIVLGDFGLARGLDLSALTLVAGSPGYVAPEQAAGLSQLDRRADLFPVGRMMLEMLAGDSGGRATTMAGAAAEELDVAALLDDAAGRPGGPSAELVDLVTRLVAKNPHERPSSADEVAATLNAVARTFVPGGGDRAPRPLTPPSAARPAFAPPEGSRQLTGTQLASALAEPSRRRVADRRVLAGMAAVAAVAVVALTVNLTRGDSGGGSDDTVSPVVVDSTELTGSAGAETTGPAIGSVTTEELGRPSSTAPDAGGPGSTDPDPSDPTGSEPTSSSPASPERLVLPTGAYDAEVLSSLPDPDHQEGNMVSSAAAFAAALQIANPQWSGRVPDVDAAGALDFDLDGYGRTAHVRVEPDAQTAGDGIIRFEIDYS